MQKQPRSTLPGSRLLKAAAACLLAVSASAMAAEEPPVRLVVPFPPGGSTDIAARIIQPKFAEALGRNVIVENKPGANTQIASAFVARSAPDGNTLLLSFDSHSINPIIKSDLPYDTFKDFKGIAFALRFPLVIGASQTTPGNNLKEFLEAAKAKPDAFNYASAGVGSLSQLAAEDLKRRADVQILHVPYAGGGPMVQSLLNGSSNITMLSFAALKANIEAGKIDRKSTRLNSSHVKISYAVFCLKKKSIRLTASSGRIRSQPNPRPRSRSLGRWTALLLHRTPSSRYDCSVSTPNARNSIGSMRRR